MLSKISPNITRVQAIVFGLNFFLYCVGMIIDYTPLTFVSAVSTMATIALSVPFMRGLSLYLSTLFIMAGIVLQALVNTSFMEFVLSFSNLSSIAAFIGIIPILAIPISLIRARENVEGHVKQAQLPTNQLYKKSQNISFSLASIMNMGALPLTWSYLHASYDVKDTLEIKKALTTSITRGFALAMLWSPIGAGVAIVADLTHSSVVKLIPFTILTALLGIVLDRLIRRSGRGKNQEKEESAKLNVKSLAVPLLLFMSLTILLDFILPYGMLYLLTVATIPFTYIWVSIIKELMPFQTIIKRHFKKVIPSMYSQIGILLSAGFFVASIQHKAYITPISQSFTLLKEWIGTGPILIVGMASVILLSIVGVHQFVAITIVALVINPVDLGISPIIYGIGMLTALSIGIMISPFNGTTAMMSALSKQDSFRIVKWNAGFTSILFTLVSFIILVLLAFY